MRTKGQQSDEDTDMFREIKAIFLRSQDTLLSDMIGAAALMTMFVIGLHLPLFA